MIEIKNISKSYITNGKKTEILKNISLDISEGEFVSIVGFSGSGKSTLMKMLAGLLMPDSGEILFNGKKVTGTSSDRGVVFQNYSLLPWLSVQKNVELAVKAVNPSWKRSQVKAHVEKYISMVNLTPALHKKPAELSGGMRQRVSVARTLATNPRTFING